MARPKGFETEKVLEKAMHLFRQKGYEATSMQEMVLCTGLSCSSLYNTFGEKHALFLAALEFYMTRSRVLLTEVISQPLPRLEIVRVIVNENGGRHCDWKRVFLIYGGCRNGKGRP